MTEKYLWWYAIFVSLRLQKTATQPLSLAKRKFSLRRLIALCPDNFVTASTAGSAGAYTKACIPWLGTQACIPCLDIKACIPWLGAKACIPWLGTKACIPWLDTKACIPWLGTQACIPWLGTQACNPWPCLRRRPEPILQASLFRGANAATHTVVWCRAVTVLVTPMQTSPQPR